jgi:molybdenum cofactor synthesis domain-containing protein
MPDSENKVLIQAVVITVSDSRLEADDISGVTLVGLLLGIGAEIVDKIILTDDYDILTATLKRTADRERVNLILTTGGTGFAPRDKTPEATREAIEREAPGLAEAMRLETLKATPTAMLSRGVCGIRGNCIIINLPGSPKAVRECFEIIKPTLQHAVNLLNGKTQHDE